MLDTRAGFLGRYTAEQEVQTNEVQRAWALLPAFLTISDGRPLDVLELGPSGGLNLVWDRYAYRYRTGSWGASALELSGDDRLPPPAELLRRDISVARRRGIDRNPIDVTTVEGARVLQSFVWPDQEERIERLRGAIEIVRSDPPVLLRGDYVDDLPRLLADRLPGTQLVVFQTASTVYLSPEQRERLSLALVEGARREPFVLVDTGRGPGDAGYSLEVRRRPDAQAERVAVFDFHGDWLEWGA